MASIEVFKDDNYLAGGVSLTDDEPDLLANWNFNDVVSSVKVHSGTFTLFKDKDFKGYSFTVCARGGPDSNGEYPNQRWLADRGDVISSVKKNSDEPQ